MIHIDMKIKKCFFNDYNHDLNDNDRENAFKMKIVFWSEKREGSIMWKKVANHVL